TAEYGPLKLNVAPKEGKANTLLADHLFSPALLLAKQIERGEITCATRRVFVELGAGYSLPSLLPAALPDDRSPSLVVVTDYSDEIILGNLRNYVERNQCNFNPRCHVHCVGHETQHISCQCDDRVISLFASRLSPDAGHLSASSGYVIVILSVLTPS
ncbi:hypothetical protein DFH29DRAFT_797479, partial [Suillus ampliporus]